MTAQDLKTAITLFAQTAPDARVSYGAIRQGKIPRNAHKETRWEPWEVFLRVTWDGEKLTENTSRKLRSLGWAPRLFKCPDTPSRGWERKLG